MAPPGATPEAAVAQRAFSALVKSLPSQRPRPTISKFVKKLDVLQEVILPPSLPRMVVLSLVERGYFTFHFESREDKNLIFRNRPYFMDSRGLYLNKWTVDFDPELDVPSAVPIWVRLPHLPLHCWGDELVRAIGNVVGRFIDRSEPKDNMQACAHRCVEVDLDKGLPEAIKLKVDD
eukprot:PITA_29321